MGRGHEDGTTARQLAQLWAEVLERDRVDPDDDFFALGGSSISAGQLLARVQAEMGVELSFRDVFDSPTFRELSTLIEARRATAEGAVAPIGRAAADQEHPLTHAQRRMWFLEQLHPDRPTYRMVTGLRFQGTLRTDALELALGEMVVRHVALRTTFKQRDGVPVQAVQPARPVTLAAVDLRPLAAGPREAEVERLAREEVRRPLDLEVGPLMRATLLRIGEEEHVLLLLVHHLAFDARSRVIFLHELGALYRSSAEGTAAQLPRLPLDYVDYSVWQQSPRAQAQRERDHSYWMEQLGADPPVLELPPDRRRPPVPDFEGARESVSLSAGLVERLREAATREGTTLASVLLTAFEVLLHRHTECESMVLGLLVAGRGRRESEGVVGLFVNELALRLDIGPGDTFRTLLPRTRKSIRNGLAHQEEPLDDLIRAVRAVRPMGNSPLFHVAFNYKPRRDVIMDFGPGLSAKETPLDPGVAPFDLTLIADVAGSELICQLEYARELFEAGRMRRMAGHYRNLLEGLVRDPDRPVGELPLVGEDERTELATWNETGREYPRERLIHELVEEQVDRAPEAVAVVWGEERLSYGELELRANRLAHHLQSVGAGPDVLVGISLERSIEMVVALLAIQKTGAAYVPLDPAFPAERLAFMAADAALPIIVTQRSLRSVLPPHQAKVVEVDGDAEAIGRHPVARLPAAGRPDGLAYVLYTSGSTGKPKGVKVPVSAVVNFLWSVRSEPGLSSSDRVVAVTTLSFDIAVLELWLPLVVGARIVLASREVAADGARLRRLVEDSGVTLMQATPTTWRLLLAAGWKGSPGFRAICGGEALPVDLAEELVARATVWNMYGPTETTVWSTLYRLPRSGGPVLIGRPLANTQLHVLDRRGDHVPVGVPGELYIGGDGVTRGYLNRPELTAERFIPDPFRVEPGARLYRTGDTVRLRSSGDLEFLGRGDGQVKLRGFRIELGEIETALARCAGVGAAVVLLREDRPGDPRLVGYVVCDPAAGPDDGTLREHLRRTLPDYMVPSAFVRLERLPLTPNNKIDRRALPAPEIGAIAGDAYVAPRTRTEELLAALWQEVLQLPQVSVEDDFFALGGHSLLAMRVAVLGQERLDVDLAVRSVFENPTVASLAGFVEREREAGRVSRRVVRVSREKPIPLSPQQYALWLEVQFHGDSDTYNVPVAFRTAARLDPERMRRALLRIAGAHEVMRARVVDLDDEPHLAFDVGETPLIHRTPATQGELDRELAEILHGPFDLKAGPLWRCALWSAPGGGSVLALVVHHLVLDNAALGILSRELAQAYAEPDEALPTRTHDFADLAVDETRRLATGREALERYWRDAFAGAELTPELPRPCVPCPPGEEELACVTRRVLGPELVSRVRDLAGRWSTTPFHVYFAAWLNLLRTYTGTDDMVVGSLVSLRDTPASEGVVGYLLAPVVLRAELDGERSFHEMVDELGRRWRDVRDHARLPMDLIVRAVAGQGQRGTIGSPFQVFFTLVEDVTGVLHMDGQALEPIIAPLEHAKFRLSLSVVERGDDATLVLEAERGTIDTEMGERVLALLDVQLRRAVEVPDHRLADLPTVTPGDRMQLDDWNATAATYPRGLCIPELLEKQVALTPEVLAVVGERLSLTYGDLNRRANQLAHHLRSLGVGPESIVGLVATRSPETVMAIYAILKAGGAYVPLDPGHPRERVAMVLEDAGVSVVVGARRPEWDRGFAGVEVVRLDEEARAVRIARESDANPVPVANPENLAYVIYTSGSTGRPKGVLVSNQSAVNMWFGFRDAVYPYGPDRPLRVSLDASLSFDASVEQVLSLLGGNTLHIAPEEVRTDAVAMVAYTRLHALDVIDVVPTQTKLLLEAGLLAPGFRKPPLLLIGGEAIDEATWLRLAEAEGVEVFNFYGPTECTVNATACRITGSRESPHIGRPLANMQARVFDAGLRQVPVGVAGELYLGGDGVARGYLNRPELTAERFVADPSSSEVGSRLYRTGDRARWVDGRLEFLGRTDGQVKLRGLRIELGEIDATLERHPSVQAAVTVVRGEGETGQLVAFVVARDPAHLPQSAELRRFLKETLPSYMVPAATVAIAALPRTSGGKVDRRALQARSVEVERTDAPGERPASTPTGKRLYEIWGDLLARRDIEPSDDFFDIGGHSLLAVRLMAEIEKAFGMRLPPSTLLQAPTLAQLTSLLEERSPAAPSRIVALSEKGTGAPLFLITPFHGDALMFRELSRTIGSSQPVYALQPPNIVGTRCQETVEGAAEEMVEMISGVQPQGPYYLAGYCIGGQIAFEVASQLAAKGQRIAFLGFLDSVRAGVRALPAAAEGNGSGSAPSARARSLRKGILARDWSLEKAGVRLKKLLLRATFEFCRRTGTRQPAYLQDEGYLDGLIASLHKPKPYRGTAVLFRVAVITDRRLPPGNGWAEFVARLVEVDVAGDHIGILHLPEVKELGEKIATAMEEARRGST